MKVCLIISTYNWPEALELVLLSVLQQSRIPDEIMIADDGSKEATKQLIDSFKAKITCPVTHCWHEDKGFRKTIVLNKAIAASTSDYHIEIDGDIILHKDFVNDHCNFAEKGSFAQGSRVLLGEKITAKAIKNKQISFHYFTPDITNRLLTIHLPLLSNFFGKRKLSIASVRGCNFAYWREDMIAINGYNEAMTGWGREDSEMAARLVNKGIYKRKLKFAGLEYHLHHPINSRESLNINDEILANTVANKVEFCTDGIRKINLSE